MDEKLTLYLSIKVTVNNSDLLKYLQAGLYCEAERIILDEYLLLRLFNPDLTIDAWEVKNND